MEPQQSKAFDESLSYSHGDAFAGFDFQYQTSTGAAPASPLARVVLQFRTNLLDESKASIVATLTSDDINQIEITSAANWLATVKRQMITRLTVGTYYWGMTFEDDDGNIDTLLKGEIQITPRIVLDV